MIWKSFVELLWPEGVGIAGAIGGHYLSRGIDLAQGWRRPFRRTQEYMALGLLGLGAYMYTKAGATKDIGKGLFHGDLTLIMEGLADKIFGPPEKLFATKAIRPTRVVMTTPTPTPSAPRLIGSPIEVME